MRRHCLYNSHLKKEGNEDVYTTEILFARNKAFLMHGKVW